jgi:hypothetical protein
VRVVRVEVGELQPTVWTEHVNTNGSGMQNPAEADETRSADGGIMHTVLTNSAGSAKALRLQLHSSPASVPLCKRHRCSNNLAASSGTSLTFPCTFPSLRSGYM